MKRSSCKYSLREATDEIDYSATAAKRTKTNKCARPKSNLQFNKETRLTKNTNVSNALSYTALKADNVKIKKECELLQTTNEDLSVKVNMLEAENKNLKEAYKHLENVVESLKDDNTKITKNYEGLNEALKAKLQTAEDLENVVNSLKADKETFEGLNAALTAKLEVVEAENKIMKESKAKLMTDASAASNASASDRTIDSTSEVNSSDATVAESIGNSMNDSMVFFWLNKIDSKNAFLRLEKILVESLNRQEELVGLNDQINVPNEEMYMQVFLKRLIKIECFLEMTFNTRGDKINIKHSMFIYCFAMSMKKKFVKVEPTTKAEQDNLLQLYKSKIQNFITSYRVLVKANPKIW